MIDKVMDISSCDNAKGYRGNNIMDEEKTIETIKNTVLYRYPSVQAIYLFGSFNTDEEWPDSDVDIATLLPPEVSKKAGSLMMSKLCFALESIFKKDVDIINLRCVSTVFQKEIISADRRIYTANLYAAEEFEMLTLSYYQKLNEERAGIIEGALADGRFHQI